MVSINKSKRNYLYPTGTDKVLISYPVTENMNHVVNIQGGFLRTVTFPRMVHNGLQKLYTMFLIMEGDYLDQLLFRWRQLF
jgi:hypothetical protein